MFYNYQMILLAYLLSLFSLTISQPCPTCPSQCDSNGKCITCSPGFSLDNTGSCGRFTPIQGCQIYSSQTGKCDKCFPGNLLQYGICQQLIRNCNFTAMNNTDVCSQCNDTFVLVNGVKCYNGLTSNCQFGSLPRQLPNGEGFCQIFQIQKCSLPSNNISYCQTCQFNYTNINGVCFNLINQTSCPLNSCNCQFYYFNNICYQFNLEGCLHSQDKIYCDLCNDSLFLVSGRCLEPVKITDIHCNVLGLNSDICQGCNFQYVLDPNYICVMRFQLCNDPTKTCQQQCNSTNLLYYSGNCYVKDPFCIAYDTVKYQCVQCYDGYSLNSSSFVCEQNQKCWVYAADGKTCVKCFTGFQLNLNTLNCDKLPYNCKQVDGVGVCVSCSNYTTLITQFVPANQTYPSNLSIAINISVCIYQTSNCQYYNTFGFCEICLPSYIQKNHQCIPVATNCALSSLTDQTKCLICSNGYTLDSTTLTCFPTLEGCNQYGSTKTCILCNTGYSLINGLCFYKDSNCLQYDSNGNCMRCQNSLIPFYNRCVLYEAYCSSYDSNGVCNKTIGGFSQRVAFNSSMQTNYKSFVAFVRNIIQSGSSSNGVISGAFTQLSIFDGFYTSQGWIKVLPTTGLYHDRILQYDVNGNIRTCKDGYTLVSGDCVTKIDYCAYYSSSNGQCIRCLPYYHMSTGRKCTPSTPTICLSPASTGDSCLICAPSYVLLKGQCYLSTLNVLSYSSTNSSLIVSVQNGYFIYSKYQIAWPYDSNCVSQTQPGICLQCVQQSGYIQSGMRIVNGACVIVRVNCAGYNSRGVCNACVSGYTLHYGSCYPNNCLTFSPTFDNCLTCPSLLTYEAGLCVNKIQSNCIVYSPIINFNATMKSVTCLFCASGYYLTPNNTCSLMITNCYITDSQSGRCTQCMNGYIIYQDNCVKQISGCQTYNISTGYSTCIKCLTNYNLLNNQCYTLPPRCLKLNSFGACSICQLGYVPLMQNNVSICIYPTANCITYSSVQGRCVVCATNYVLQNNLCNFYILGCLNTINGICYQCMAGYYLVNGSCLMDQNCVEAQAGMCTKCAGGFMLVKGWCVKNTIDSCLSQQNDDCLQCANGFERISLYGQVYCIFNNIIYSGCSTQQYPCLTCLPGFILNNDGFCYAQKCLYTPARFSMRVCTACNSYYQLDSTNSFCVPYNCQVYNNDGICSVCASPYIAVNGICLIQGPCINYNLAKSQCQTCATGYFLDPSTGFCKIKFCLNYNKQKCVTCNNGFVLDPVNNTYCVPNNCQSYNIGSQICQACQQGFVQEYNLCVLKNCYVYNSQYMCQQCLSGFTLSQSNVTLICIKQFPSICSEGYYFSSNQSSCQQIPISNCSYINPLNISYCLNCFPNFFLYQGRCYPIDGCMYGMFSYISGCKQCNVGYHLNFGVCVLMPLNCVNVTQNGTCINCTDGYFAQNGICFKFDQNCVVYNATTYLCSLCAKGFYLDYQSGNCLRNKNELIRISSFGQYSGTQYKPGQSLDTQLLYCIMYNPPPYVNNYLSILVRNPQIIHYIQIQGFSSGYVTSYMIQYRNKANSPLICWNSCQKVNGNVNGDDITQLQLLYPMIASEIRIYPLTWINGIWMTVDMLVESQ